MGLELQIFSYPSVFTYVLGAQKNRLNEMFWLRNKNVIFLLRMKIVTKSIPCEFHRFS